MQILSQIFWWVIRFLSWKCFVFFYKLVAYILTPRITIYVVSIFGVGNDVSDHIDGF